MPLSSHSAMSIWLHLACLCGCLFTPPLLHIFSIEWSFSRPELKQEVVRLLFSNDWLQSSCYGWPIPGCWSCNACRPPAHLHMPTQENKAINKRVIAESSCLPKHWLRVQGCIRLQGLHWSSNTLSRMSCEMQHLQADP